MTRRLQQILRQADLPTMTFHQLRHAYASLLVARNVHPRAMDLLGHADVATTMAVYSHATKDLQREVADSLDDLLRRQS